MYIIYGRYCNEWFTVFNGRGMPYLDWICDNGDRSWWMIPGTYEED